VPYVERGGVRLHYEVAGDGPPLFLLIGGGGDGSAWRKAGYISRLEGDYRCIAVDPRGFGGSGRPAGAEGLRPEEMAADVVAIADELGLERFTIWGHSAGSFAAFAVAVAQPSRVSGIVGAGSAPDLEETEWRQAREWARTTAASARQAGVLQLAQEMAAGEGIELPAWLSEMFDACDPEMFAGLILMLNERFWSESLQIEPPRLVLNGDQEVTPDWVVRASLALPNTEIVLLPGKGHIGGFLACEEAVTAARGFLDWVTAGTAAASPSNRFTDA
jgi:pimeloyl-ACP methyl ester carboxylesterase